MIQTEEVTFRNINSTKDAMNLKDKKEWYTGDWKRKELKK